MAMPGTYLTCPQEEASANKHEAQKKEKKNRRKDGEGNGEQGDP